jgi:hypothetical protein
MTLYDIIFERNNSEKKAGGGNVQNEAFPADLGGEYL